MPVFQRKHKDPAQEAYRTLAREKAMKKKYDFIGSTGKMDPEVHETDKYRRAEEKFKAEIAKPLEEGNAGHFWYPTLDHETLEVMNSNKPEHVAKKASYVRETVRSHQNAMSHFSCGRVIEDMYMPYSEKHKLACELLHHDPNKKPDDRDFHSSKMPIDKVLEEMTRYRPNAENRERIRNAIDTFKTDPKIHRYLKDKYQFATTDEEVGPYKHYEPHETVLTAEEVNAHKDKYKFVHGRTISEPWDVYGHKTVGEVKKWQLHPDGTKTRISNAVPQAQIHVPGSSNRHQMEDEDYLRKADYHHNNLKDLHGDFLKNNNHYHSACFKYTKESRGLNRYLAKGDVDDDYGHPHAYDEQAHAISSAMRDSPPYAHNIQVWSGVSRSNDIGAYALKKKDDKEKLVGHFPAFTSTSFDIREAEGFAKEKEAQGFTHQKVRDLVRIDVPKAYHRGIYVSNVAQYPDEKEYILDRGHDIEVHPKPLYYAKGGGLYRVWKARPIIHSGDEDIVKERVKKAREW